MREKKFMCGDCRKCFTTPRGVTQHLMKGRCKPQVTPKDCFDCKYLKSGTRRGDEVDTSWCKKTGKDISSHNLVEEIPEWCPLRKGE